MVGLSKMGMMSVPLKSTIEVDFVKSLKNHVKRTGSSTEEAMQALSALTKSRNLSVLSVPDRHETGLNTVQRYYDQFVSMEKRFPITDTNELRVSFTWKDSFISKGVFAQKKSMSNGGFEKVCVLYNVAAFMTQMASAIRATDDASMQNAMKLFQQACGIFEYLRDNSATLMGGQVATNDVTPEFLGFLAALTQAHAQECIWVKAYSSGKMKPKVLSQVTAALADLYETAYTKANAQKNISSVLKDEFSSWLPDMQVKIDHYKGISQYYLGKELRRVRDSPGAPMKYGEEIARYQLAESHLKYKSSLELLPNNIKNEVKTELNTCIKDNNLIYHDPIPDKNTLPAPEKTVLAKPIAFDVNKNLSKEPKDLFGSITPLAVASALEYYDQKSKEFVSIQVAKLRENNDTLNGILASLNLPAAIEDTKSGELPASLWEKAEKLQKQGGVNYVNGLISDLPSLLERNKEILDESIRLLKEEQDQDARLLNQYKAKWNRTPSTQLTKQLSDDQTKYQTLLQRAKEADVKVKAQFEENLDYMRVLSLSKAEIEQKLPSSQASDAIKSPEAQQLRELMKEVDAIKVERSRLEEKLQAKAGIDVINAKFTENKFLNQMTPEGSVNAVEITETILQDLFGTVCSELNETITKQEQVLQQIQAVNSRFAQLSSGGSQLRDEFLKKLAQAYDSFEMLVNHLNEGRKFYGDLTEILLTHQGKVNDFVFARNTEKEDLLKDITSSARSTSGQPNAPSYHANIPSGGSESTPTPSPAASTSPSAASVSNVTPTPPYSNPTPPVAASAPTAPYMNNFNQPPSSPMPYGVVPPPSYNPYMPMNHQMYSNPYGGGGPYGAPQQMPGYPAYPSQPPYGMPGAPQNPYQPHPMYNMYNPHQPPNAGAPNSQWQQPPPSS